MFCSKAPRSLRNKENCLLSSVGCWGKISRLNNNECKKYGFEEGEYLCVRHFDEERKQKQQPGCCFPKRSLEDTCSGVLTNCPQRLVAVFKELDAVKTGYGKICLGHLKQADSDERITGNKCYVSARKVRVLHWYSQFAFLSFASRKLLLSFVLIATTRRKWSEPHKGFPKGCT